MSACIVSRAESAPACAVCESSVILLHPPLPSTAVPLVMESESVIKMTVK